MGGYRTFSWASNPQLNAISDVFLSSKELQTLLSFHFKMFSTKVVRCNGFYCLSVLVSDMAAVCFANEVVARAGTALVATTKDMQELTVTTSWFFFSEPPPLSLLNLRSGCNGGRSHVMGVVQRAFWSSLGGNIIHCLGLFVSSVARQKNQLV